MNLNMTFLSLIIPRFKSVVCACCWVLRSALTSLLFMATGVHAETGTLVRMQTQAGPIDIQLYDSAAPRTVANFLSYVQSGAYDGSIFHRLVRGFVLQGGGLKWADASTPKLSQVPVSSPVTNEFSPTRSNVRGTVAMAKVEGNPDSATNQWFVNLTDNAANLDSQNGGFTVFGKVLTPGMAVVDGLTQLQLINASGCTNLGALASALSQMPMFSRPADCESVAATNLLQVSSAKVLPARHVVAPTERVFEYIEAAYPQYASPASPPTQQGVGILYRYYSKTQSYFGAMDGEVYAVVPSAGAVMPVSIGPMTFWLETAQAHGY